MTRHGAHAIWFERHVNPAPILPDIGIATLAPVPHSSFLHNLPATLASARWRSQPGESFINFRDRIRRELEAEGTHGVLVSVYERGGHFERNAAFAVMKGAPSALTENPRAS